MMTFTQFDARQITGDYVANGNHTHFRFGGKIIKGYSFTWKQLNDLVKNNQNTELFMMLALSPDSGSKYLNVVVASMLDSAMGTMIISDNSPYTDEINFDENIYVKSLLMPAIPITPEELRDMQGNFETADSGHLSCTTAAAKIKAYTLSASDLSDLKISAQDPPVNEDDIYMFMPVIRPTRPGDPANAKDYVSLAVARFDPATRTVVEIIMEYCLPCPKTCATNYWH